MSLEVRIPAMLLAHTGGQSEVTAAGDSIDDVVRDLDATYPGFASALLDDSGLRRHVNIYVNGKDVRFTGGIKTRVAPGDSITILPSAP